MYKVGDLVVLDKLVGTPPWIDLEEQTRAYSGMMGKITTIIDISKVYHYIVHLHGASRIDTLFSADELIPFWVDDDV